MRLLLVDDETLAIDGLMENLLSIPFDFEKIYTAGSKAEAQEILDQNPVDMIICDIEMPNGNGLELLSWVKEKYPKILTVILSCHDEFSFAQQAVRLSCFDYILKPATPDILSPVMEHAFTLLKEQQHGEMIQKIGESYVHQMSEPVEDKENVAKQIKRFIAEHIADEISVEQLAQIFYLSADYLTRCFKKEYGKTISEYVMDLRLSLAAEMLKKNDMSITAIAEKVGYPNYTYFIRLFKKRYNVSPAKYRQQNA